MSIEHLPCLEPQTCAPECVLPPITSTQSPTLYQVSYPTRLKNMCKKCFQFDYDYMELAHLLSKMFPLLFQFIYLSKASLS